MFLPFLERGIKGISFQRLEQLNVAELALHGDNREYESALGVELDSGEAKTIVCKVDCNFTTVSAHRVHPTPDLVAAAEGGPVHTTVDHLVGDVKQGGVSLRVFQQLFAVLFCSLNQRF